ncbi:MAG: 4-(cytidine 5'-diphospho)-2-C-methyl-D-erythritol kinase [Phycisphaerales bacterium]
MEDRSVHVRHSYAKLNLALAVSPPLPAGDRAGWHEITSWFVPVSLHDTLTVTRLEDDRLSRYAILWAEDAARTSPIDWSITKDLAVRAHRALEAHAGRTLPVQMKLEKRIPVGGGLGGGSSNAGAMLLATRTLFARETETADLPSIGGSLGSDVPYFVGGQEESGGETRAPGAALVEGFGDRLERTPPVHAASGEPVWATLIFPSIGCPTPGVYRAFDAIAPEVLASQSGVAGEYEARAERVRALARGGVVDPDALFNDLAPAAQTVAPAIAELRAMLSGLTGLHTHITGSGSTLFQIAEDEEHALRVARDIGDAVPKEDGVAAPARLL